MMQKEVLPLEDGELWLVQDVLDDPDRIFDQLLDELAWQGGTVRFGATERPIPRLQAWYGDAEAHYAYSGLQLTPLPWTDSLSALRTRAEQLSDARFNSVLCNLYRDGQDSVSWHADNETCLGRNPVIASLSLGATRTFHLRHRRTRQRLKLPLNHNTLLVMRGSLQHHWYHAVLKEPGVSAARINLTFRRILPAHTESP
ncbi:alpha-ketoglutarate-dependent dioxygenase AlkB [Hahella sp. SMD15-11]|uniref:Alpha-ketoglutarate-dependent dioxygenase AlkB n=1 Tax=Thermohahella caldifontis TaxID=3142973 RepID=A0AB39UX50_9GAMM